jgi:lysyl endopeptidase
VSAFAVAAFAGVPVHIVKTDLKPLIRAGMDSPVQFAVLVPHAVSATSDGSWSTADGRATWRYAVDVPTAVSLSFHATKSSLPASATLVVRSAKTTASYRSRDLHRGELWSRIQPGEALQFTLTVAAEDRSKVAFNIVSLQAGYRSLGPGVKDHPYYLKLRGQPAASGNAACVTNYMCEITTANTPPGAATVALVTENLWVCSGSLINDVPGDNTPYLLTARHCETGQLGGGNPGAASTVTVYWDATTPCGEALGSIYDTTLPTQTGAQTMVEQQDAWLIELDVNPVVSNAQFAGFDASGGAVQGGYTIHHAEGYDKQFAEWYGQAFAVQASGVLGTTYVSNFWETVNQLGNVAPGASGSGLFDQNNHLVGSLSLGRKTTDPSGYEACPVSPLTAPNGTNGVADFTALASVWNSTADTTSSTGSTTLKSVLDPGDTGTVVVASAPVANITFSASTPTLSVGQQLILTWSAPGATQCTAQGGVSGDGWTGTLAASGAQSLTESATGFTNYTLNCAYPGGKTARTSVSVTWLGPTPVVQLTAPYAVWTTRPAVLSWTSNVAPCSISGGGLSLSNLAASGTTTTTQTTAGEVSYMLTCGPPNDQGSSSSTVMYATPSLVLEPTGTDRILGEVFALNWRTYADSCTPSGGAPNDGWATTAINTANDPNSVFDPKVTTLGAYTYTLTCTSGPLSVQQSVTVTFEDNAPYTTASLSNSSVTYTDSPADYVSLNWNSNLSNCIVNTNPSIPYSLSDPLSIAYLAQGSLILSPPAPGAYVISVTCGTPDTTTRVTSTPLTLTVLPPPPPVVALSISPSSVLQGQEFTASWSSTNATYCAGSGGITSSGWDTNGAFAYSPDGTFSYSPGGPGQTGQFTFVITCESIAPGSVAPTSAQAQLTVEALSATLTASATTIASGSAVTLTWSSTGATGCSASGGGANGAPWSGSVGTSGTLTQTATSGGTFTYTLVCSGDGYTTAPQQVTVTVTAQGSGGSGSTGGHGGGGAIGLLELALLGALRALRRRSQLPAAAERRYAAWFP